MEKSKNSKDSMIKFGLTPILPYSMQEAINRLRINISFLGSDVRKIMIVSSEPNEGKSFVAINLWNQMAESGEKTLLIDADMRNSNICTKYALERMDGKAMKGTSHYLANNAKIEDVLMHTNYGEGDIMPNTENIINPSMLLDPEIFGRLLDEMAEQYRYVFVDVPPLGLVSDGELIGNMCDGAILCVRSGETPKRIVRDSVHQLERVGCPLLGIVLNRVSESKSGYGRYGSYYGGVFSEGDDK